MLYTFSIIDSSLKGTSNEICVDGADSQLIFYRADVAIQPREETFRPFVEEAVEIYQVLSDSNTQKY